MSYAPVLTSAQIERIREFAEPRNIVAGETLYEPGDETPPVFVVIDGGIKIVALGGGREQTVTTYDEVQKSQSRYELLEKKGNKEIYLDHQTGQKVTVKRAND